MDKNKGEDFHIRLSTGFSKLLRTFRRKLTNYQIIAAVFIGLILFGAGLLCLPISTRARCSTPFINALFTATSATCVTGLITYDTFTYWSGFGQAVILILIQIGGLGFMTLMTLFSMALKRQLSLSTKTLFIQSTGNNTLGTTKQMIKQILLGTLICEGTGTILLSTRLCPAMGFGEGLYSSLFHSVSAFCNAGFDIMGRYGQFSSLTAFYNDVVVNLTICSLIVVGGIGFLVWNDILRSKWRWKRLCLHSKLVLSVSGILILGGWLLFLVFEWNASMVELTVGEKVLASLFQAISPRTAGFNTVNLAALSESGRMLTVILMFIGGSPGSTAGGIKTTTVVVLFLTIAALIRKRSSVNVGKRSLEKSAVTQATAIIILYLSVAFVACLIICATSDFPSSSVIFEVVSAIGTVGLTIGITPYLNVLAKLIIIFLMFSGRVGMLSLVMIFSSKAAKVPLERPVEKIIIG